MILWEFLALSLWITWCCAMLCNQKVVGSIPTVGTSQSRTNAGVQPNTAEMASMLYGKNRAGLWESRRRIDLIEANIVPLPHALMRV